MSTSSDIQQNPLFILLVLTFIAAVAGFLVYDHMEDHRKQTFAHENFQPVQARVLEAEVNSRTRDNRTSYRPSIRYRYEVDGKGYKTRRYSYYNNSSRSKSDIEAIVAEYPVGGTVTAYYNPENPKRAVLDNSKPDATMFIIFICLFSAVYLFIVGVFIRQFLAGRKSGDEKK